MAARVCDTWFMASTQVANEDSWVLIPEGFFLMGSDSGGDNEKPVHRVWVSAFELAAFQVTNEDYAVFVADKGHRSPPFWRQVEFCDPRQPVVGVSWQDAAAYCDWLSRRLARHCRLPTEAEWERAARGGREGELYPWGNEPPQSLPDYAVRWRTGPEKVGLYPPSAYGLYNLGDNVHEWCADWYDSAYYAVSPAKNPQGLGHGRRRSSRGGAWRHEIKVSTCAARSSIPPTMQYSDYGFRVARDLPTHGS